MTRLQPSDGDYADPVLQQVRLSFSGTESYLFDLIHRMDERGHETALFTMDHRRLPAFTGRSYRIPRVDFKDPNAGLLKKVRMAAHAIYSLSPGGPCGLPGRLRGRCRPRARHLPPFVAFDFVGVEAAGHSVVYHLNDFKLLCQPTSGRRRTPCELCIHGAFHHAATNGCYDGRVRARRFCRRSLLHKWLGTYEHAWTCFWLPANSCARNCARPGSRRSASKCCLIFRLSPATNNSPPTKDTCSTSPALGRERRE